MQWRIAHRGASGHYPENTMLAFEKALEQGANALEMDIHCCASGEAVVIHDTTVNRTTNGVGLVAKHTLAELKTLDAGNGERIPTLTELLDGFAARATIFIEVKVQEALQPTAKAIKAAVNNGTAYENLPVISYHRSYLQHIRALNPAIVTGVTPSSKPEDLSDAFIQQAVADGMWSVNPNIEHLTESFTKNAQTAGLKVICWTANAPELIEKAKRLGVDGVMSDYPDRL